MLGKPKILFLCTGHPERSEMAEGFTRALAPELIEPVSAAVEPVAVDPLAVDAMKEVGIDISAQEATDVKTALKERYAYVVGVGDQSKERCPVFPFAFRLIQWSVEDPRAEVGSTERRMDAFRRVRNQIAPRVRELLALAQSDNQPPSLSR
jgi:arsenate reductase